MLFKFTIIKWRTFSGLKRTFALKPFHCTPIISVDSDFLFIFVLRNRIIYGFISHFLVITGEKTNKQQINPLKCLKKKLTKTEINYTEK